MQQDADERSLALRSQVLEERFGIKGSSCHDSPNDSTPYCTAGPLAHVSPDPHFWGHRDYSAPKAVYDIVCRLAIFQKIAKRGMSGNLEFAFVQLTLGTSSGTRINFRVHGLIIKLESLPPFQLVSTFVKTSHKRTQKNDSRS